MKDEQAKECWAYYFAAFPDSKTWMAKQGNKTLDIWKRVILHCDYDDVSAVINAMIDGDIETPKAYERDTTAQLVKRAANDRRFRRQEKQRMAKLSAQATAPKDPDGKFFYAMRFCLIHKQPQDACDRIKAWAGGGPHPGVEGFAEDATAEAMGELIAEEFARVKSEESKYVESTPLTMSEWSADSLMRQRN
jgi:hypothetical protein